MQCDYKKRTDERQPHELKSHQRQDGQRHPQDGLGVDGEPEEAAVGRVDLARGRVAALEDPAAVARRGVDLVPPAQADQSPPGDVLQVVEVGGEQEDSDDED